MNKDICKACGEPLEIDQEWKIIDRSEIGTEATGPMDENYIHADCSRGELLE